MPTKDGTKGKSMGMFDNIIVPKSYLKGLLTKEQEKLVSDNSYQTKSLDKTLRMYKVYKQKLYAQDPPPIKVEDRKWNPIDYTGEIYFYDNKKSKKGASYWIEFRFVFLKGKLDAKYLEDFYLRQTAELEVEDNKNWEMARAKQIEYEKTVRYKIYFFFFRVLYKLLSKVRRKVTRYDYDYGTKRIEQND